MEPSYPWKVSQKTNFINKLMLIKERSKFPHTLFSTLYAPLIFHILMTEMRMQEYKELQRTLTKQRLSRKKNTFKVNFHDRNQAL